MAEDKFAKFREAEEQGKTVLIYAVGQMDFPEWMNKPRGVFTDGFEYKISGDKVKVNSFKKSIGAEHKAIYKKAAKLIGAKITYSDSPLGDEWETVYLVGDITNKQKNLFHEEVIALTMELEHQQYKKTKEISMDN